MTPYQAWLNHVHRWRECKDCRLCEQRDKICIARGSVPARVLFIGEAPGPSENLVGQPFVGPAGHELNNWITRVWKSLEPYSVPAPTYALTNLVCCFPREAKEAGDNEPDISEIKACRPRLQEFVEVCRPELVVFVGSLANTHGPAALGDATCYAGGRVEGHDTIKRWVDIIHPAHVLRAPLAQKGMMAQRAVVILTNALEEMCGVGTEGV